MQLEESPYATLEVARSASPDQIEQAYHRLKGLLADGQLAAYGMLEASEVDRQREQLELAFELLRHADKRQAYDQRHFGVVATDGRSAGSTGGYASAEQGSSSSLPNIAHAPPPSSFARAAVQRGRLSFACPMAESLAADVVYDGPLLRRLRESAGASLEDFCEATKISRRYLKAIEADDFGLLPAPVYVRGFVSEYARLLGLQAKTVADSYVARLGRR